MKTIKITGKEPAELQNCSKLFRVKVTYDTVIYAESENEALRHVSYGMGEIDDMPTNTEVSDINKLSDLPSSWGSLCLPWGDMPEGKTISSILLETNKEATI